MTDDKEDAPPKIGDREARWQSALAHPELGKMLRRLEGMRPAFPSRLKTQIGGIADVLRPVAELNDKFAAVSSLKRSVFPEPASLAGKAIEASLSVGLSKLWQPGKAVQAYLDKFRQAEEALARLEESERELVWGFIEERPASEAFAWVMECARLAGDDVDAFRCVTVTAARFGQCNIEDLATKRNGSSVAEVRQMVGEHERLRDSRRTGAQKANQRNERSKAFVFEEARALFAACETAGEEPPRMGKLCELLREKLVAQSEEIGGAVVTADTIEKWLKTARKQKELEIPAAVSRDGRTKK